MAIGHISGRGHGELDTIAGAHAPGCGFDGDRHTNSGALDSCSAVSRDAYANLSI